MELIRIQFTQLVELFATARVHGQANLHEAVQLVRERYAFAQYPQTLEEMTKGLIFKDGRFDNVSLPSLEFHDDGIVIQSQLPSSVVDDFVKDLFAWMEPTIGLRRIATHPVYKTYQSELIVRTEAPILKVLGPAMALGEAISRGLKQASNLDVEIDAVGFSLATDNTLLPVIKPIPFRIDRRAGVPFEANLYYTQAPLPTSDHLKVLEQLEKMV